MSSPPDNMLFHHLLLWATYKQNSSLSATTFDTQATSAINETQLLPATLGPTWITSNPERPRSVLVVGGSQLQTFNYAVGHHEHISWALTSALSPTNLSRIVHGSYSNNARFVFAADYDAGQVRSFSLSGGGHLEREVSTVHFEGQGAYAPLQSSSHPHEVYQHPTLPWVYVNDLGTDQIHVLRLIENGTLVLQNSVPTPPATGPRHSTWHPSNRVLYLIGEISSHVTTWTIDESSGNLTLAGDISVLPAAVNSSTAGYNRQNGSRGMEGAEVVVSRNGSVLYAANRNQQNVTSDQIATVKLETEFPYRPVQESITFTPSGGLTPRGMRLDQSGRYLAVGNQNSASVSIFSVNDDGGLGNPVSYHLPSANQPAGVIWAK